MCVGMRIGMMYVWYTSRYVYVYVCVRRGKDLGDVGTCVYELLVFFFFFLVSLLVIFFFFF